MSVNPSSTTLQHTQMTKKLLVLYGLFVSSQHAQQRMHTHPTSTYLPSFHPTYLPYLPKPPLARRLKYGVVQSFHPSIGIQSLPRAAAGVLSCPLESLGPALLPNASQENTRTLIPAPRLPVHSARFPLAGRSMHMHLAPPCIPVVSLSSLATPASGVHERPLRPTASTTSTTYIHHVQGLRRATKLRAT
ncbi:hypothetical protein EV127DRAFT_404129 [Xylaria flabelliformis]|nr:hypothetical protein EV127DRAFT_404129 [Xylaria flabelliformis]